MHIGSEIREEGIRQRKKSEQVVLKETDRARDIPKETRRHTHGQTKLQEVIDDNEVQTNGYKR